MRLCFQEWDPLIQQQEDGGNEHGFGPDHIELRPIYKLSRMHSIGYGESEGVVKGTLGVLACPELAQSEIGESRAVTEGL